jgi:hypothetical protein
MGCPLWTRQRRRRHPETTLSSGHKMHPWLIGLAQAGWGANDKSPVASTSVARAMIPTVAGQAKTATGRRPARVDCATAMLSGGQKARSLTPSVEGTAAYRVDQYAGRCHRTNTKISAQVRLSFAANEWAQRREFTSIRWSPLLGFFEFPCPPSP